MGREVTRGGQFCELLSKCVAIPDQKIFSTFEISKSLRTCERIFGSLPLFALPLYPFTTELVIEKLILCNDLWMNGIVVLLSNLARPHTFAEGGL